VSTLQGQAYPDVASSDHPIALSGLRHGTLTTMSGIYGSDLTKGFAGHTGTSKTMETTYDHAKHRIDTLAILGERVDTDLTLERGLYFQRYGHTS
jgi:hypothetical protein